MAGDFHSHVNAIPLLRISRRFSAVAGGVDFATGLALVIAPSVTLTLMGATSPDADVLGYIRFIGIFVTAVGASYLWAFARGSGRELRTVFLVTLIFRSGVALYVAAAVISAVFEPAWSMVAVTDFACAVAQVWLLVRGVGRDG